MTAKPPPAPFTLAPSALVMDFSDIKAQVVCLDADHRRYGVVLSDGRIDLVLAGNLTSNRSPAVFGAQRAAVAIIDFAAGLSLYGLKHRDS